MMESQHVDLMRFSPELNPKMEPLPHESYRGIDCQAQNDNTIWHQPWSKTFGDIMEKALEGTSFLRPQKPTTAQEEIFDLLGTADVFTPPKTASETLKFETQPENRLSSVFLTPPSSAPRKPSNPNGFERTRYLFDINENTMYQKVEIPLATGQQPSDSFTPPKDGDVLLHQILENPTPASNELGSNGVSLSSSISQSYGSCTSVSAMERIVSGIQHIWSPPAEHIPPSTPHYGGLIGATSANYWFPDDSTYLPMSPPSVPCEYRPITIPPPEPILATPRPRHSSSGDDDTFCSFCKRNRSDPSLYRSHMLRNPRTKRLTCPVLRAYQCKICGATDDAAHTESYCPKRQNLSQTSRAAVRVQSTTRTSTGKFRKIQT